MKALGKRILRAFALLWILALCAACLFACADGGEAESTLESESGSESESVEPWGEISFRTLTVQGTRVQGTVPHETESFSFREEIVTEGDARYLIARDPKGREKISAREVALTEGDNVFYVLEYRGEVRRLYTVTVRRQPVYTVTLDTAGGKPLDALSVKEGELVDAPTPTREGYRFLSWDRDLSLPVTEDVTLTARWEALPIAYTVRHYVEAADGTYVLRETERGEALFDATLTPATRSYEHYVSPAKKTVTFKVDGSTVVDYRYARRGYTLRFVGNGGRAIGSVHAKWGTELDPSDTSRDGYIFGGWFSDVALTEPLSVMPAGDTTAYAWWREETKPSVFTYEGTTEITITGCVSSLDVAHIPAYIGGKPVVSIGDGAFRGRASLRRVTLPETLERVGVNAFADCPSLLYNERTGGQYLGTEENPYLALVGVNDRQCVDFYVRTETEIIAGGALAHCSRLGNLSLGIGVRWIGANAFYGCDAISTLWYAGEREDWRRVTVVEEGNEPLLRHSRYW